MRRKGYKASTGAAGNRISAARSWGKKAGRGHLVWSFAWSAAFLGVSRRQAGFKANIGTEGVSASQIPIIPPSGPSVVLLRVEARISSVGATETGQGAG